jgi:hypothetical protein
MMEIVKDRFWKRGEHTVGYTLYKLGKSSYMVQYAIPTAFRIGLKKNMKRYKSLESAEIHVAKFEKDWPKR